MTGWRMQYLDLCDGPGVLVPIRGCDIFGRVRLRLDVDFAIVFPWSRHEVTVVGRPE